MKGDGWGRKEKSERVLASRFEREAEGLSNAGLLSAFQCLKVFGTFLQRREIMTFHVGLGYRATSAQL